MKVIKYFNEELINGECVGVQKEYKCEDAQLDYWISIITVNYGRFGEVTWEEVQDPIDPEDALINKLAESDILSHKGSYMIGQLAKAVAQLNIEVNKLKGV